MHWNELKVWQKAHALVLELYKLTATFPKTEIYSLVDQIKRAAYSIAANIAEGQSRNTTKEYIQFLYISRGSLNELPIFAQGCFRQLHNAERHSFGNLYRFQP